MIFVLGTASPFDTLSWTIQTYWRQITEGIWWQLMKWLTQSPNPSSTESWLGVALLWLLRGLGLVLLAFVLYLSAKQLWRWVRLGRGTKRPRSRLVRPIPEQSRASWLAIAQQAQQAQDYRRAFEALYRALLIQLHESGMLLQDTARTDREYIRGLDQLWSLVDKPLALREDWVTLFETHELLCFGGADLQGDRFAQCQSAYNNLAPYLEPR